MLAEYKRQGEAPVTFPDRKLKMVTDLAAWPNLIVPGIYSDFRGILGAISLDSPAGFLVHGRAAITCQAAGKMM
jgi:hypothetical protein